MQEDTPFFQGAIEHSLKVNLGMLEIIFDIATKTYRLVGPVVDKAFHDGLKLKG